MHPISTWQYSKSQTGSEDRKFTVISWNPILIGLILIPINSFGILLMRVSPTFAVPFYNVILFLLILVIINSLWKKFRLQLVLSPPELCVIYVMLSCSTALTCKTICWLSWFRLLAILIGTQQLKMSGDLYFLGTFQIGWQSMRFGFYAGIMKEVQVSM